MIRIVLDTNVFISGFLWDEKEAEVIRRIERKEIANFINPAILVEIENVINRRKFRELLANARMTADEILQQIISLSHIVVGPNIGRNIIKSDVTDDKFIECALNSKSGYIVSGDRHLLDMKEYNGIKIITPKQFLEII